MSVYNYSGSGVRKSLYIGLGLILAVLYGPVRVAGAEEPIKIAAIFSMSGPATAANAPSLEGVRWAVEELNAAGGVLGRKLALIEIDNLSTPIGAKVAADMAVEQGVAAIVGAAWSSHSIAVAKVAQAHKIPMISNISTHPSLTGIGDYIFRVCYNDLLQGQAMAQFASTGLEAKSVVICFDLANDYSQGLSNSFQAMFESLGGQVLRRIPYKARQSNFRGTAALVKQLDPDVLFIPGYDESGRIITEAMRMGVRAIPIGGDGWDAESFFRMGGDQITTGYYATHWSPAIQTEKSLAFVAKYSSKADLMAPAALGYDAAQLLADALRRAGTAQPGPLRDALAATRDYEGVTGRITFNANRDPVKSLVIMKVENGHPHYLMQARPAP
jgi:branched-chain amino acid transport system substrate-binding protein